MFGYAPFSVIEHNGLVGMIDRWEGNKARIMFEHGDFGVEFAWYPVSGVSKFKIIG